MRALPPAQPAAGKGGGGLGQERGEGSAPRQRVCGVRGRRGGGRALSPCPLFGSAGQDFQIPRNRREPPRPPGRRPRSEGRGEGRRPEPIPRRFTDGPRREPAEDGTGRGGAWREPPRPGLTGAAGSHLPTPGSVYRAPPLSHGGHGANADLARAPGLGRKETTTPGRGRGRVGARRAGGTTPPSRCARAGSPRAAFAPPASSAPSSPRCRASSPPAARFAAGARPAGGRGWGWRPTGERPLTSPWRPSGTVSPAPSPPGAGCPGLWGPQALRPSPARRPAGVRTAEHPQEAAGKAVSASETQAPASPKTKSRPSQSQLYLKNTDSGWLRLLALDG